ISSSWLLLLLAFVSGAFGGRDFDYRDALSKSIVFLEAQRSGKLPAEHRPSWRGDSALQDGKLDNVDLVGGYYDAGDNVKYGLPLAFTVTTLSWAAIAYSSQIQAAGESKNLRDSILWGADYLLKASSRHEALYVQVGDPVKDHECWIRPENMKTPRTLLKIDGQNPGTEIAAETSAALAAASIVFQQVDRNYSHQLLNRAKNLFEFAKKFKGTYDGECPFYCSSSGYNASLFSSFLLLLLQITINYDELLWAATWLYKATQRMDYLDYIQDEAISASVSEFSWDLKYAGSQVLLSDLFFKGVSKELEIFKQQADSFVCSILPDSPHHQVYLTPGGLIHMRDGANTQYVTSAAFLFSAYSDILAAHNKEAIICGDKRYTPSQLMDFAKRQMDYILGNNPKGMSYMVGFGEKWPKQAHHRGSSVPKLAANAEVNCAMSFVYWYNTNGDNPNELTGAIVGGPDKNDAFEDRRTSSAMTEPTTYINSLAVGVLAKLAKYRA
ncbi:hypothetical protein M569_13033, partial [Genlisea aurea]